MSVDWSVDTRIANAARRGIRLPDSLLTPPPMDRLVVCHADACCPNTLIEAYGVAPDRSRLAYYRAT